MGATDAWRSGGDRPQGSLVCPCGFVFTWESMYGHIDTMQTEITVCCDDCNREHRVLVDYVATFTFSREF